MLREDQVRRVTGSYGRLFPFRAKLARGFYERLFEAAPEVRPLFPEDMEPQRLKFAEMLHTVVTNLPRLDEFIVEIQALGQRHNSYGATPAHYAAVGQVLVATIAEVTPGGLSEDEKAAWEDAYGTLSSVMQRMSSAAA